MKVGSRFACISAAVLATLYGGSAVKADLIWDPLLSPTGGTDGNGTWDLTTPEWFNGTTNVVWDNTTPASAILGTSTSSAPSTPNSYDVDLGAAINVQNLTFNSGVNGGSFTYYQISDFGGGSLTLKGNLTKASALGGSAIVLVSNSLTLTAGNHVFSIADTAGDAAPEFSINGSMIGSGGVTLDNGTNTDAPYGTLAYLADNSYTGGTTISKGRLEITTSGGLGSGAVNIGTLGNLTIGGNGSPPASSVTLNNAITIARNTYTGTDFKDYPDAITSNNNGQHTVTINNLVIDSTDGRVAANTSTVNLPNTVLAGPNAGTLSVLTLDGDFAGTVNLSGNNTVAGAVGAFRFLNGVEINVSSEANLGGATSKLYLQGGEIHPTGALASGSFMTNFGSHDLSGASINTGVDIDAGNTFTVNNLSGIAVGTRGTGTINFTGTNTFTGVPFFDAGAVNITGATTLGAFRLRSSTLSVGSGAILTLSNSFSDIGSDSPDNGTVNLTGTGQIINNGSDFNITDNAGTKGTLNISGTSTLTSAGGIFVGKSSNTTAVINQSGGTVNANRTGQFSLDIGGRSDNNGTGGNTATSGTYYKTGGSLNVAGEMYIGNSQGCSGTFIQSAGATTVNSWIAAGRIGSTGTVNLSGGTLTKQGGGNSYVGESINTVTSTMTVSGTGVFNDVVGGGEFWVGQAGGSGILNIGTAAGQATNADAAASFTVNNWLALGRASNSSVGVLNLYGGTLTKPSTSATNSYFAIGSGGTGNFNQTGGTANIFGTRVGEASNGTASISGGTDTFTGEFSLGYDGLGLMSVSGNANVTLPMAVIGAHNGGGTLNLNGGTVTAVSITAGTGTGPKVINFNGGTLRASAGTANFVGTLVTSVVSTGGAKINTNGVGITYNSSLTHDASLSGADGGLTVTGAGGTLSLMGASTYTGPTIVDAPSTSTLPSGTLQVKYAATGTSASSPLLTGPGGADIRNGQVVFDYTNTTSPATTIRSDLAASYATGFASGQLRSSTANASRGLGYVDNTSASAVTVKATYYGDLNLDGKVDISDLSILATNFGANSGAVWANGDVNYDNKVDISDLTLLATNFGAGSTMPLAVSFSDELRTLGLPQVAVPEPMSLTLLSLAGAASLSRRRRV